MVLPVSLKSKLSVLYYLLYSEHTGVVDGDYEGVTNQIIMFEAGDVTQTHRIQISDDVECEGDPNEFIFSNIALYSGIPDILVTVTRATVTIDDYLQGDCSEFE